MNKEYCYSCGYELQDENKDDLGYINKIDPTKDTLYCKRCYEMIYRNKAPQTFLEDKDYWNLFKEITKTDSLFVLVVDVFNIHGSLIEQMLDLLKDKEVILVLNKRDILPKIVKDEKIIRNTLNAYPQLKALNLIKTICTSTVKKYNIDLLLETISENMTKTSYLVGTANVGKSSLINTLISSVTGDNKELIATSYYSGTTLGLINIPLTKENDLIDTPGLINNNDLTTKMDKSTLEIIVPKTEVRPRTYQLKNEQALFLTGFCQMNYLENKEQSLTVYVSNQIEIHRTKYEKAEQIRKDHLGNSLLTPPSKEELKNIKFSEKTIEVPKGNHDVVIDGLGWVNFKNEGLPIKLSFIVPEEQNITLRKGLI